MGLQWGVKVGQGGWYANFFVRFDAGIACASPQTLSGLGSAYSGQMSVSVLSALS
jgi:hypothetical protein